MARRYVDRKSALRSLAKGFDRLQRVKPHAYRVNYAANCANPVTILRDGVTSLKKERSRVYGPDTEYPVMTELEVPCRKCEPCLRRRAAHWRMRANSEWQAASRTWFGTLTLRPEIQFRVTAEARLYWAKALQPEDRDFDAFPPERQFAERHAIISKEITRFVKRIRESSGAELRLLCIAEEHKSGMPHYHMLIHEVSPAKSISKAQLEAGWKWGFSHWRLVKDGRAISYVTKYLSKSMMARVRASIEYGQRPDVIDPKGRENPDLSKHRRLF